MPAAAATATAMPATADYAVSATSTTVDDSRKRSKNKSSTVRGYVLQTDTHTTHISSVTIGRIFAVLCACDAA